MIGKKLNKIIGQLFLISKQIRPAYISKYNNNRDNQVILLMITDNNKELELENKFIDNRTSVLASLSCLLDDLSEIN